MSRFDPRDRSARAWNKRRSKHPEERLEKHKASTKKGKERDRSRPEQFSDVGMTILNPQANDYSEKLTSGWSWWTVCGSKTHSRRNGQERPDERKASKKVMRARPEIEISPHAKEVSNDLQAKDCSKR